MLISVARGPNGRVRVFVAETEDMTGLQISFGADVSPAEGGRVLFESGVAILQAGNDFLVSADWLHRHVGDAAESQPDSQTQLVELLAGAAAKGLYVNGFDAIRVPVTHAGRGD